MQPLISVIIPVYKAEKTLMRCVDSVLSQTYENLEVLLIEDGSPDSSGQICEAYEQRDRRVTVIYHNKTGPGPSGARNTGVKAMKGDYVTFVDSDDALHPQMIEILHRIMVDYQAEIVTSSKNIVEDQPGSSLTAQKYEKDVDIYVRTGTDILVEIMAYRGAWEPWGKLFNAKLLPDDPFIEGKFYGDYYFTPRVFSDASRVVSVDCKLYYYIQNPSGISGISAITLRKDLIEIIQLNLNYIQSRYQSNPAAYQRLFAAFVEHSLDRLKTIAGKGAYNQNREYIYYYRKLVLRIIVDIFRNKFICRRDKIAFGLSILSVRLIPVIFSIKLRLLRARSSSN